MLATKQNQNAWDTSSTFQTKVKRKEVLPITVEPPCWLSLTLSKGLWDLPILTERPTPVEVSQSAECESPSQGS